MSEEYADLISKMVRDRMREEHNALEEMCERMLVTPDSPGISVQRTWKTEDMTYSCITETRLNPDVPFGEIHYLPDVHEGNPWGAGTYGD